MTTKLTYASAIELILNGEPMTDEVREKLTALKASLDKRNAGERKQTAQQVANEGIRSAILSYMAENHNRMFTITEIMKEVPACAELTNQRVTALVRQLKDDGKVERIPDGRKAYFRYIG